MSEPNSVRKIKTLAIEALDEIGVNPAAIVAGANPNGSENLTIDVVTKTANFTADVNTAYLVGQVDANTSVVVSAPPTPANGDLVSIYCLPGTYNPVDCSAFIAQVKVTEAKRVTFQYYDTYADWGLVTQVEHLDIGAKLHAVDANPKQASFTARAGTFYTNVDTIDGLDAAPVVVAAPSNPVNGDEVGISANSGIVTHPPSIDSFIAGKTVTPGQTVVLKYLSGAWRLVSRFNYTL